MTRRTRSTALPALALLAGLAACGASDAPDRDAGENTRAAANSGAPAPDLAPSGAAAMDAALDPNAPAPEAKTGTIAVAGATAEITFKRFETPPDFPLQFVTYVPEDMIVETLKAGKAEGVRVISNIGGRRKESAYVWAMFHPPGTAEAKAREAYAGLVAKRGNPAEVPERARRFAWALAEHEFQYQPNQGETRVGRLALGRRGDRFFHVIIEYPEDLAGEFVPRVNRILEDWRWKDGAGRIGDARSSR